MIFQIGIINHALNRLGQAQADNFHIGELVAHGQETLKPLNIGDKGFRRAIFKAVLHLICDPPRIHADNRDAGRRQRPIKQHPFRIIAEGQRHAVALFNVIGMHPIHNRGGLGISLRIAPALIFINQIGFVAMHGSQSPDIAQSSGRIGEGLQRLAAHLNLTNGKHAFCARHFGANLS